VPGLFHMGEVNDFERDIEEALEGMKRIANKARPKEDAAELIRKIRDGKI